MRPRACEQINILDARRACAAQRQCRVLRGRSNERSRRRAARRHARRARSLRGAQTHRRHDGARRVCSPRSSRMRIWCRTATVRTSSSSPGSPTNGTSTPRRSPSRRSKRCATGGPCSRRRTGRRPISTGSRTSSPGAFRASSGGDIRSRPGMRPGAPSYVAESEEQAFAAALADGVERGALTQAEADATRQRSAAARRDVHARRGRARHLVLFGALAVLDARLAGRDAGAQALLSDHTSSSPASTSSSSGSPG